MAAAIEILIHLILYISFFPKISCNVSVIYQKVYEKYQNITNANIESDLREPFYRMTTVMVFLPLDDGKNTTFPLDNTTALPDLELTGSHKTDLDNGSVQQCASIIIIITIISCFLCFLNIDHLFNV